MKVATFVKRSVLPAVLLMLPLTIAAASPGRTPTSGAPPKYVGVDAEATPTWTTVDTPSSNYYLGQLRSEKFFYNYKAIKNETTIPASDTATTYEYNVPGCGAKRPDGTYVYPSGTLCIIVWNYGASTDGSDLKGFLESTLKDKVHQYLMTFCNETEIHQTSTGCKCDHSGKIQLCMNSAPAYFINQFEAYSAYITKFENQHTPKNQNVHVAEISASYHYQGSNPSCEYIVPAKYVSHYLVDVYEKKSTGESLKYNAGWKNWVHCTSLEGSVSRGIAEYGIDCGSEPGTDQTTADTYKADAAYLKQFDLEVWNLWDAGGCTIKDSAEPLAVTAWRNIEAAG